MGRTKKTGIDVIRHDTGMAEGKNTQALIEQYGSDGYVVYTISLDVIYHYASDDAETVIDRTHQISHVPLSTIRKILASCVRLGLYNREAWAHHKLSTIEISEQIRTVMDERAACARRYYKHTSAVKLNTSAVKSNTSAVKCQKAQGFSDTSAVKSNTSGKVLNLPLKNAKDKESNKEKEKYILYTLKESLTATAVKREKGGNDKTEDENGAAALADSEFLEIWKLYPERRRCSLQKTYDNYTRLALTTEQRVELIHCLSNLPASYVREDYRYMPSSVNFFATRKWQDLMACCAAPSTTSQFTYTGGLVL